MLNTKGSEAGPRGRTLRRQLGEAAFGRLTGLPPETADYVVTRDLRIPMRDGEVLLADHLAPSGSAVGTVLVRSPYGFDAASGTLFGSLFASRGFHVVQARARGTFGSGGAFEPTVHEVDDAADTVAWLRDQPWFGGRFATFGASYLGFTQWALLMDPPAELTAAVIQVGPHDYSRAIYAEGAFNLADFLGWSDQLTHQEQFSSLRGQVRSATATRRQAPAMATLPLASAADQLCEGRATWFRDWVGHRDLSDPYWSSYQLESALDRVRVPVLLQTGWQDPFLRQTLAQYAHLHERKLDVALTVGPWTHLGMLTGGARTILPEALQWLDEHLAGTGSRDRSAPVRIHVTGAKEWRDLPSWPPTATDEVVLYPQPDGRLSDRAAPAGTSPATFTYDPADPTPTVGGRLLSPAFGGYKRDNSLAERPDVLTFTGQPLAVPLEVIGIPVAELAHRSDNPHVDLFVRVSDVDLKGKSRNVSDGLVRLGPSADGVVRVELDQIAHRFAAGHRIRLLIGGGSFPRFERNLGTGMDPASGITTAPSPRNVDLADSRLLLPMVG